MIITGLDTETTGLSPDKGDRIIEIALLHYDFHTRKLVDKYVQRIDPQRPIDAKAQAVHGIAYEELVGCPTFNQVASEIRAQIARSGLLVAHNMNFDAEFVATEFNNAGVDLPMVGSFCSMENARWACFDGKMPKLEELCFALGEPYDRSAAHAAEYDVDRMMQCYFKAVARGFFPDPTIQTF